MENYSALFNESSLIVQFQYPMHNVNKRYPFSLLQVTGLFTGRPTYWWGAGVYILGPTMIIVYINDFPSAISNVCMSSFMHADDLAVQISCSNINLVNQLFLSHVNSVAEDWTAA